MTTDNKHQAAEYEDIASQGAGETGQNAADGAGDESANVADRTADAAVESDKMADEVAQWHDKYMRLQAEFDNYRKRTLKEKMDIVAAGGEDVIKALLPVVDDLDRALAAMENASDVSAVREGVVLIAGKLRDTLASKGVVEIEAVGKVLDTDFHEAIAKIPAQQKCDKGKIVDCVQKGYKLNDKVIRHSKVVVGE